MAVIHLTGGWTPIPEGVHVFRITGVTYKEAFGKLEVNMETAKGQRHTERFALTGKNGQPNEGAMNAFAYFARRVMNDPSLTEIEPELLTGRFVRCVVKHDVQPSTKNPGETVTWVRLDDKEPADGFDEEEPPLPDPAPEPPKKNKLDLSAILG